MPYTPDIPSPGRRRPRPRFRAAAVLTAAAFSSLTSVAACYEYAPPPGDAPRPGTEVRVALTDLGSINAASAVGPRVESVDGRLLRVDADSVVVAATQTTQRGGNENLWSGERVAVARAGVASLNVRRISPTRTALAAAVGVAAVVGAIAGFHVGSPGNGGGTTQVPTPK